MNSRIHSQETSRKETFFGLAVLVNFKMSSDVHGAQELAAQPGLSAETTPGYLNSPGPASPTPLNPSAAGFTPMGTAVTQNCRSRSGIA